MSAPALVVTGPFSLVQAPGLRSLTIAGITAVGVVWDITGFSECPDLMSVNLGMLMIGRDFHIGPGLGQLTTLQLRPAAFL